MLNMESTEKTVEVMRLLGPRSMKVGNRIGAQHYPDSNRRVKLIRPVINGSDYDQEHALKHLHSFDILTVDTLYTGGFKSAVSFKECPEKQFNTVLFEDIE